jgi:hypothetical protein
MAAHLQSLNVQKYRPPVMPDAAGKLLVSDGSIESTAAAAAINSTVGLCVLPARCVAVDFTLIADDIDTHADTPTITLSAGVIASSDLQADTDLLTESTIGQGGGSARATALPAELITPHDADRVIGVKVIAGAAVAAAGTLRGILTYRSEEYGA